MHDQQTTQVNIYVEEEDFEHLIWAERVIIANVLLDPWDSLALVVDALEPDDFFDDRHASLFRYFQRMHKQGRTPDAAVALQHIRLSAVHQRDDVVYLAKLLHQLPPKLNPREYIIELLEARSRLKARDLSAVLGDPRSQDDMRTRIDDAQGQLIKIRQRLDAFTRGTKQQSMEHMLSAAPMAHHAQSIANENPYDGMLPSINDVHEMAIGGPISPGTVNIIGARPLNGKTLYLLQWLVNIARYGFKCCFFSQEMSWESICERAFKMVGANEHHSGEEVRRMSNQFFGDSMIIFDQVKQHVHDITQKMDYWIRHEGIQVFALDYIQLLQGEGRSRYEQVTYCSQRLREFASTRSVTLLIAAQLNRECPPIPKMHYLKESGQLEQDADNVMLLRMPVKDDKSTKYSDKTTNPSRILEVHTAKLRNRGPDCLGVTGFEIMHDLSLHSLEPEAF